MTQTWTDDKTVSVDTTAIQKFKEAMTRMQQGSIPAFPQEYDPFEEQPGDNTVYVVSKEEEEMLFIVAVFTDEVQAQKYIREYDVFNGTEWFIDEFYLDSEAKYEDEQYEETISAADPGSESTDSQLSISASPYYASDMSNGHISGSNLYVNGVSVRPNGNEYC